MGVGAPGPLPAHASRGSAAHHCPTCSLAYLHHLVKAHEPLAVSLLALHNLHFMNSLMAELRQRILADDL